MDLNNLTYSDSQIKIGPECLSTKIKPDQVSFKFTLKASEVETLIDYGSIKDNLYQDAILNLIKKNNFLQLYIQLIEEQISESEYEKELTKNSEKYFIRLKSIDSEFKFTTLLRIVQHLPKILSLDQISEVFGIKSGTIINRLPS